MTLACPRMWTPPEVRTGFKMKIEEATSLPVPPHSPLPGHRDIGWNIGQLMEQGQLAALDKIIQSIFGESRSAGLRYMDDTILTLSVSAFRASDQRCQLLVQSNCRSAYIEGDGDIKFENQLRGCTLVGTRYPAPTRAPHALPTAFVEYQFKTSILTSTNTYTGR